MNRMLVLVSMLVMGIGAQAWSAVELAKVNGRSLTDKDMEMALSGMNEGQRQAVLKDVNSRREILRKLVDQELLTQEGEKQKIDQTQEYKDALAFFRKQYLSSKVLQKNLSSKLTDKAAKKYYESHLGQFSTDRVHVQHILAVDLAEANEIMKKVKEPSADFQEIAEKLSKDPSAKNNRGDLGMITHDSPFVEEFKKAAFEGAPGEIVGPVKTAFGYHVIKVVEKKPGKPLEYSEVELRVKQELQQNLVAGYVSQLKKGAKITVDEKALTKQ